MVMEEEFSSSGIQFGQSDNSNNINFNNNDHNSRSNNGNAQI